MVKRRRTEVESSEIEQAADPVRKFPDLLPKLIKERGDDTMMTILFDEAEARGEARGRKEGEKEGEAKGENRLATLINKLFASGRGDEVQKAASDEAYRAELFKEFQIN